LTWTTIRVEQLKKLLGSPAFRHQIAAGTRNGPGTGDRQSAPAFGLSGRAKSPSVVRRASASPSAQHICGCRAANRAGTRAGARVRSGMDRNAEPMTMLVPMSQRLSLLELNEAPLPLADRRSTPVRILLTAVARRCQLPNHNDGVMGPAFAGTTSTSSALSAPAAVAGGW